MGLKIDIRRDLRSDRPACALLADHFNDRRADPMARSGMLHRPSAAPVAANTLRHGPGLHALRPGPNGASGNGK